MTEAIMTTFEATSREQVGRLVAAILEFTGEVKVTNVSGTDTMFLVEADLSVVANDDEIAALHAIL